MTQLEGHRRAPFRQEVLHTEKNGSIFASWQRGLTYETASPMTLASGIWSVQVSQTSIQILQQRQLFSRPQSLNNVEQIESHRIQLSLFYTDLLICFNKVLLTFGVQ